jgi:hypothetical protein
MVIGFQVQIIGMIKREDLGDSELPAQISDRAYPAIS